MVCVYKKAYSKIYSDHEDCYIIHNTKKPFHEGHTHINNFNTAVYLINLALHKSVPNRNLKYFIHSLIRISTDKEYINKLMDKSKTILQKKKERYRK